MPAPLGTDQGTDGITTVPILPRDLCYMKDPCADATGPAEKYCQQVASLSTQHEWERQRQVTQRIYEIYKQSARRHGKRGFK